MTILIRNCSYLIKDSTHIERDVDLLIEGNHIAAIGKELIPPENAEILDGENFAVMPGLVNSHTHLYQNLMKGISAGLPLVPWCNQVLFPSIGSMRKVINKNGFRLPYLWTTLASIEMIKGGITSCVNMDTIFTEIMNAWQDIGFRGVLAYTLANKWVPSELRSTEATMKKQMLDFIQNHHHPEGLTTVFAAPSTLFLCTDDFLQWAGEVAQSNRLGFQIHIAETGDEVSDLIKATGRTPVEHLNHLGLLKENLSAVHCVHLGSQDFELLASSGSQVVHCPKSNMKLADGIAPIVELHQLGVPVSLATDGCASNDLLDMWEEMRAAIMLARVSTSDANAMLPQEAFRMATVDAARVAHLDAGELIPGKLADIAMIDLQASHLQPFHNQDILNMLVFCAKSSDVRHTIINGEIIMRDRRITRIDETSILNEIAALDEELIKHRQEFLYSPT